MTPREERAAILGADVVQQLHQRVALAPALAPTATTTDELRRILTRPAAPTLTVPTPRAA